MNDFPLILVLINVIPLDHPIDWASVHRYLPFFFFFVVTFLFHRCLSFFICWVVLSLFLVYFFSFFVYLLSLSFLFFSSEPFFKLFRRKKFRLPLLFQVLVCCLNSSICKNFRQLGRTRIASCLFFFLSRWGVFLFLFFSLHNAIFWGFRI